MDKKNVHDRVSLLADVAEMYYLEEKNQAEIATSVGVTRSMISRMLTDARELGMVEIWINRPLHSDLELESALKERFGLLDATAVVTGRRSGPGLTRIVGMGGARLLKRYLAPGQTLALTWGTTVSAAVDAFEATESMRVRVAQLTGAMGTRMMEYDGHELVARMAAKLGGDAYFLNAPYLCETADMAHSLLEAKGVREAINLCKQADVLLLGIGTTLPEYSYHCLSGYLSRHEVEELRRAGAVGDVCGMHFDMQGRPVCQEFSDRVVAIRLPDLLAVRVRLGVAGGEGKADAILGALRGKYVNVLVIDSLAARKVLELAKSN